MAYDHALYSTLISLKVPRKTALALADSNSPIALKSTVGTKVTATAAPAALTGSETLAQTITQVNALRTALITAGVLT